jgi:ADP-ribose pyrophosphatase YjhB (NUDIX family)
MLPSYSTHYIGVGGIVLNSDQTKVLLIKENGPNESLDNWKFPGGLVEGQESIESAIEREVWEETGIKTTFSSILGFRETQDYKWGQTDLYFVCVMKVSQSETIDVKMPIEISKCEWIDISALKDIKLTSMAAKMVEILTELQKSNEL